MDVIKEVDTVTRRIIGQLLNNKDQEFSDYTHSNVAFREEDDK